VRDIAATLLAWQREGLTFAVATVVATWKSAPRQAGAAMAINEAGEVVGSISGGCVEAAVYEVATQVLQNGAAQLVRYGVSDGDALEVGLTCGGIIDILVVPIKSERIRQYNELFSMIEDGRPVALVTLTSGTSPIGGSLVISREGQLGTLGSARRDSAAAELARGMLASGATGVAHLGVDGQQRGDDLSLFIQSFTRPPLMLVFGAIDFASAVARIGRFLGYYVVVCDARPIFAAVKRFPDADEVIVDWPHRYLAQVEVDERTAICVLTHDPKFDIPLLTLAVRTKAGYIGVMGSRRTHEHRMSLLRAEGLAEADLARLSSPIGLDLGARTPQETAISIAAEIIALSWGGTGTRLAHSTAAIHR
jgi:xanthine dehydrogenase accessory factor